MSNWLERRPTNGVMKPERRGAPWSAASRAMARIDENARIMAYQDTTDTQINMTRAEQRKHETLQMLRNTDEVIDEAMRLANHNEAKLEVFGQMVMGFAKTEASIYGANHNPFLRNGF